MKKSVVGRPKKYKSSKELIKAMNEYFDVCERDNMPLTLTGLGLSIGLTRAQMITYAKDPEFLYAIGAARMVIEEYLEKAVLKSRNPSGAIFLLKNLGYG